VTKLVTVGGDPRIQGLCVVFDPETLRPAAILDGVALTLLRTAAVSALALGRLAPGRARRLVIFGTGPQARAHAAAIAELLPSIEPAEFIGRAGGEDTDHLVASADVICCCTTAATPLFDGGLVRDGAAVIAIGSHQPDVRELDAALLRRAGVVVEARGAAGREAGDLIMAGLDVDDAVTLRELVGGAEVRSTGRPAVFKSVGMAWEDAVVAVAVASRAGLIGISCAR
jgi:ornithine cyclodeaminase